MKLLLLTLLQILLLLPAFSQNFIQYVNPFIGTKNMGHTFPGATTPFGSVQLSPETNNPPMFIEGKYNPLVYKYCAGYQYSDSTIFGFSHTHFSGTGHSDLGDLLLMPTTGKLRLEGGSAAKPHSGYHSGFSHSEENAEPAYYQVKLADYDILAELTATERVGFHQYTFPASDSAHIILDLTANIYNYDDKNVWTFVRVENDSTVSGYRQTTGWARTRTVYFVMQFSKAFISYGHKKYDKPVYKGFYRRFDESLNFPEMAGRQVTAFFNFKTKAGEKVKVKMALSGVSTAGAMKNLQAEIPHWDFEKTKRESQAKWNKELAKIEIETVKPEDKTTFYTALYHCMLSPIVYEDVDGQYRGLDQNIHQSDGFTNYSVFSLWDTYRALHPLFNLLMPQRNNDMIKSMLAHYDQSVHKMLPIWSHYANENWCMIGYHAVSVIADAMAAGHADFDTNKALEAALSTATRPYFDGLSDYMKLGYVPEDKSSSSASKTLEFAYDDYCISEIARRKGDKNTHALFSQRSRNYANVYDAGTGFVRPKLSNGQWKDGFDPLQTEGAGFIEGNAWTYSLSVPHDVQQMIAMMGGDARFTPHLDSLFSMKLEDKYIEKTEDITRDGIIGNYVHGNEPGHHIPYLYNFCGSPEKTQERVRMIMNTMYGNKADGLCGNDDAGQMSAWYVFSALGFYPACPGSGLYEIGSPMVTKAVLHLENGRTLRITTKNQGEGNVYVEKVLVNGEEMRGRSLLMGEVTEGGEVVFYLSGRRDGRRDGRGW